MIFRRQRRASNAAAVCPHPQWVSLPKTQDGTFGPHFAGRKTDGQKCGASRPGPFAGKPATAGGGIR